MKKRILMVLLALPLVAFDCGGEEKDVNPIGLGCTIHVGGAVASEDLWCIATAYDYSAFPDPQFQSTTWGFVISGYRGAIGSMLSIGAGGGFFLDHRPDVGTTYWWNGPSASSTFVSGGFDRYDATMDLTHASFSHGTGSGEGSFSVTFTAIPSANATNEELLGAHGSFTATLPPLGEGFGDVTLSARF